MKKNISASVRCIFIGLLIISHTAIKGQPIRVAILDFENISGKSEYDGLGKAFSNMMITDLKNNIHPRRVEFFERGQLNKLLDEQKLQKSKNFDASTAVKFGKLSGVNYVFLGSIFILDQSLSISSRLIDVTNSKVILSKDVSGLVNSYLLLKTQLSEAISAELNNPVSIPVEFSGKNVSLSTIQQYGKILNKIDEGDLSTAEQYRGVFEETNPEFAYFKELRADIDELKKQVAKNTADIEILNQAGGRVIKPVSLSELMTNITNPLTVYDERKKYLSSMLSNSLAEFSTIQIPFYFICNLPSGGEFLNSFKLETGLPTSKSFDLISRDLDFINSMFESNSVNKTTFSHYTFYYLRNLVNFKEKLTHSDIDLYSAAAAVAQKLIQFNKKNNISAYNVEYFGGKLSYAFTFNHDEDLSTEHLYQLLIE